MGGQPKEEGMKLGAMAAYVGKRARKGKKIDGFVKPMRVLEG